MGNEVAKLYLTPVRGPLEFQYRIHLALIKQMQENARLDEVAAEVAKETEAELRARFAADIVEWTSVKNRPFEPLPLGQGAADEAGVFARGPNCEVRESLIEGAGRGLFALRVIKKGAIIEFFDGRVVSTSAVKSWQTASSSFCTHCISLARNLWTLDCTALSPSAVRQLRGASFANSDSKKRSNAQVRIREKNLTLVAFLVAKQDIQPGDEIVYNYATGP